MPPNKNVGQFLTYTMNRVRTQDTTELDVPKAKIPYQIWDESQTHRFQTLARYARRQREIDVLYAKWVDDGEPEYVDEEFIR